MASSNMEENKTVTMSIGDLVCGEQEVKEITTQRNHKHELADLLQKVQGKNHADIMEKFLTERFSEIENSALKELVDSSSGAAPLFSLSSSKYDSNSESAATKRVSEYSFAKLASNSPRKESIKSMNSFGNSAMRQKSRYGVDLKEALLSRSEALTTFIINKREMKNNKNKVGLSDGDTDCSLSVFSGSIASTAADHIKKFSVWLQENRKWEEQLQKKIEKYSSTLKDTKKSDFKPTLPGKTLALAEKGQNKRIEKLSVDMNKSSTHSSSIYSSPTKKYSDSEVNNKELPTQTSSDDVTLSSRNLKNMSTSVIRDDGTTFSSKLNHTNADAVDDVVDNITKDKLDAQIINPTNEISNNHNNQKENVQSQEETIDVEKQIDRKEIVNINKIDGDLNNNDNEDSDNDSLFADLPEIARIEFISDPKDVFQRMDLDGKFYTQKHRSRSNSPQVREKEGSFTPTLSNRSRKLAERWLKRNGRDRSVSPYRRSASVPVSRRGKSLDSSGSSSSSSGSRQTNEIDSSINDKSLKIVKSKQVDLKELVRKNLEKSR